MPRADQLPDDLKDLAYRDAVELTGARWRSDVRLLIDGLRPHVGETKKPGVQDQVAAHRPMEPAAPAIVPAASPKPEIAISPTAVTKPMGMILAVVAGFLGVGVIVAYMTLKPPSDGAQGGQRPQSCLILASSTDWTLPGTPKLFIDDIRVGAFQFGHTGSTALSFPLHVGPTCLQDAA